MDIDGENFPQRIFETYKIDVIIHTATEYGRNNMMPSEILKANLMLPLMLIERGTGYGVSLFINTDSYFNKPNKTYLNLLNYSLSKKCLNQWLEILSSKCKVVNLRLEHMYGTFDSQSKFCESIIQSIAIKKNKFVNLTFGEQKRDFVYVDDVCNAYLAVLKNYETFHFNYVQCDVGTGGATSIKEFAEYVKECANSDTELCFGAIPYRDDEMMISVADTCFLKNWGFEAKISYKQGIESIIKCYNGLKNARGAI